MNTMAIVFYAILFFFLIYFIAFEYSRYKMARMMARELAGKAVYRIHGSYMKRHDGSVEERAWVKPDDKMAWGSVSSILWPSTAVLYLLRCADPGLAFLVEPKTGVLVRPMRLNSLKDSRFNVPTLDDALRLSGGKPAETTAYFLLRERQEALVGLFSEDFSELKGDRAGILATRKNIRKEDLDPEKIQRYFRHLQAL